MKRTITLGALVLAIVVGFTFVAARAEEDLPAMKLKGKPAPAVSVNTLDGSKLNLADLKDKKIVILDFWATWCGPCVKGLPVVAQIAKDHADKDVVLYAVNEQEEAADIKAFLQKQNLDVKVALDSDGKVGTDYSVTGIPQTVIIGKDGVIKVVHVGVNDTFKDELTKDLEQVIADSAKK